MTLPFYSREVLKARKYKHYSVTPEHASDLFDSSGFTAWDLSMYLIQGVIIVSLLLIGEHYLHTLQTCKGSM